MSFLRSHPSVAEALISLAILAASYLAARILSLLFGKVLARAAARTASRLDDRLIVALQRPLAYALFLVGAYVAIHRLPLHEAWTRRMDGVLFVFGVLLLTLALLRAYQILLEWLRSDSRLASPGMLSVEFGPLLSKIGTVFIVLVATSIVLQHFGLNPQSLIVSLGVGSLAVGLAAQDTLANMFAGFTLMLDRPFRVGDRIQLASGETGDVEAIGMRATRIRTPDETLLVVPNSVLVKERLVNISQPSRELTTRVEVAVKYGSDLPRVRRILCDAALAGEHVMKEREPVALVTRLGEYAVNLQLVFWTRDYREQGLARSEVHEQIYRRLGEAGIEIPLPTSKVVHEGEPPPPAAADEVT